MRRRLGGLAAAVVALGVGGAAASGGCSGYTEGAVQVECGDFLTFPIVSRVLELRCGSLDCHGSLARPFRLFGKEGQRYPIVFDSTDPKEMAKAAEVEKPNEYYPGGLAPTTLNELKENYRSVCGLEPELTTRVQQGQESPDVLTIVRKMRLTEKHKGGKIFEAQSNGDVCLTGWLTTKPAAADASAYDRSQCDAEYDVDF